MIFFITRKMYFLAIVLVCTLLGRAQGGIFARTDKKVTLERIVDCPERKNEENFHISYVKCNRTTRCIRANITLTQIVGPQSSMSLEGSKWSDGGWKSNAFIIKLKDPCSSLNKILGNQWEEIMRKTNMSCPVAPGTYVLNDYFINLDRIPIAFMYGMYNIRFTLSTKNQLMACKDFVISVN